MVVHLRFKGKSYNNMRSDILQIIIDNAKRVLDNNKELRMIGNLLIEPLGGTTIDVLNITLNLGGATTIQPTKTVPPSTGLYKSGRQVLFPKLRNFICVQFDFLYSVLCPQLLNT